MVRKARIGFGIDEQSRGDVAVVRFKGGGRRHRIRVRNFAFSAVRMSTTKRGFSVSII